ncbi:hypothetical protein AeMF1_021277 [Aphanomyces euteiches]|nr:hypothetical protein AeMF1_021277 [Aphanomyces euteiches]KAH9190291.1 hypothetical protein AeNC1_007742 [Aphanomyces euteiches]
MRVIVPVALVVAAAVASDHTVNGVKWSAMRGRMLEDGKYEARGKVKGKGWGKVAAVIGGSLAGTGVTALAAPAGPVVAWGAGAAAGTACERAIHGRCQRAGARAGGWLGRQVDKSMDKPYGGKLANAVIRYSNMKAKTKRGTTKLKSVVKSGFTSVKNKLKGTKL